MNFITIENSRLAFQASDHNLKTTKEITLPIIGRDKCAIDGEDATFDEAAAAIREMHTADGWMCSSSVDFPDEYVEGYEGTVEVLRGQVDDLISSIFNS